MSRPPGHLGAIARDNRLFVEAVLYRYPRSGIAPHHLHERLGGVRMEHLRHSCWSRASVWQRIFEPLTSKPNNEYANIYSIIVWTHQCSAGAKKGPGEDSAIGAAAAV